MTYGDSEVRVHCVCFVQGILVGSQGNLIHTISEEASADIEKLLQCRVNLVLFVKK